VLHPETQEVLYNAATAPERDEVENIEALGIDEVGSHAAHLRYALGLCAACYGRDLARGSSVNVARPSA